MSETSPTTDAIPLIDLRPFLAGEPGALEATAARLRGICETVGFLYVVGHGVPADLIGGTFAAAERFHAQPLEAKMKLSLDEGMQGYMPYRSSVARANALSAVRKPNENEAFFVKPERDPERPANRWPDAIPEFRPTALRCFAALEGLALRMLPLYARALDLPADHFDRFFDDAYCSLRLTHYPAMAYGADEFGIAPHTDSSFITLLAQNPVPGLQIRTRDGEWIDAPVIPDSFVVNTGDVLKQWSNGRFISTPHRAFNKEARARYAIPFFFHPSEDTLIAPLPTCVDDEHPPRYPAQTVGEYMAAFRSSNYDRFRDKKTADAPA